MQLREKKMITCEGRIAYDRITTITTKMIKERDTRGMELLILKFGEEEIDSLFK